MARHADSDANSESDDVVMLAVQRGDVARLSTLFERYQLPLFNFFLRMTGDRHLSEDLVQDVFLRILKHRSTYKPGNQFRAWMYAIGRNLLSQYSASSKEVALTSDANEVASPAPGPAEALQSLDDCALSRAAMRQLPQDRREVLILSRFHGLKYEEVGAVIDCSGGAVKLRVHRAMQELRDIFMNLSRRSKSWSASN
jgi:RNA polymerase sigma factor (sigma-70 family)